MSFSTLNLTPRVRPAFTLIELLIVVAIIAILAAIAVPNFLEAQTRSKVSRVKADLRTVKTALESYCVDHNKYMNCYRLFDKAESETGQTGHLLDLIGFRLTSPIAYLTSIPGPDPFVDKNTITGLYFTGSHAYMYTNMAYKLALPYNSTMWNMYGKYGYARQAYTVWSVGPNKIHNGADWIALYGMAAGNEAAIASTLYDPTNGTVSGGDIATWGGDTSAQSNW